MKQYALFSLEQAVITPRMPVELQGYGDRTGFSSGVHDDLLASCLYTANEHGEWIWISLDVCMLSVELCEHFAERIAEALGISPNAVILSAVHTHAGPDLRIWKEEKRAWAREYLLYLEDTLIHLAESAKKKRMVGFLQLYQGEGDIGVNRRFGNKVYDKEIFIIRVMRESGEAIGTVFLYGCHLTVLGSENYLISADWLGYARNFFTRAMGESLMFIQGAEGNVDPESRGVLDMTDPNQSKGDGFEKARELGERIGGNLLEIIKNGRGRIISVPKLEVCTYPFPLRYGGLSPEEIEGSITEWKRFFAKELNCSEESIPEGPEINELVKCCCQEQEMSPEATGRLVACQFAYVSFLLVYRFGFAGSKGNMKEGTVTVDAVVLNGGDWMIVTLPMEVLTEANALLLSYFPGKKMRIASIVNGWYGYLPAPKNYMEVDSDRCYETVSTLFAPNTLDDFFKHVAEFL